jgi:hypothetical protein
MAQASEGGRSGNASANDAESHAVASVFAGEARNTIVGVFQPAFCTIGSGIQTIPYHRHQDLRKYFKPKFGRLSKGNARSRNLPHKNITNFVQQFNNYHTWRNRAGKKKVSKHNSMGRFPETKKHKLALPAERRRTAEALVAEMGKG